MRKTLAELGEHYGTDKVSHGYLPHYEKRFAELRDGAVTVLEIGIASGGSLRMWRDYFARGDIHGIDCKPDTRQSEDRLTSWLGHQEDAKFLARVVDAIGAVDIVIDDGSHRARHHLASFASLWPHVKVGGWYCIEDCFTLFTPTWTHPKENTIVHYLFRRQWHILTGQGDIGEIVMIGNNPCDGLVMLRKKPNVQVSTPYITKLNEEAS
jgi:hypothetical protein